MSDINITATNLRRQLKQALRTAESGEGRVLITRHGKVVAILSYPENVKPVTVQEAPKPRLVTAEDVKEAFEAVKDADQNVFKVSVGDEHTTSYVRDDDKLVKVADSMEDAKAAPKKLLTEI